MNINIKIENSIAKIITINRHEPEFKECLALKKSSRGEYLNKIESIYSRGNYKHNMKVIEENRGYFVVKRRPPEGENVKFSDFVACPYCYGFCLSKHLKKHRKTCNLRTGDEGESERYIILLTYLNFERA